MFSSLLKNVAIGIILGLVVSVCGAIAVMASWSTLKVAALPAVVAPIETTVKAPVGQTPSATATDPPTPLPTATAEPTRVPTLSLRTVATATVLPLASPTPRAVTPHFLFGRPLAADAPAPAPNSVYLYGTTELGQYEVHHGVDFDRNPIGVPVYAVGDGTVVSAGDDRQPLCGDKGQTACGRFLNFYGLVTVIRLNATYRGQTLYALYGHQSRLDVEVGRRVRAGDRIGAVGMTGIAIGPHIQFEIRLGANDYASTRNPMLWIKPLAGRGVLAGRYVDKNGKLITGAIVDVYRAEAPDQFYKETESYGRDEQPDVNSDDAWGENWALSDLPAGEYIVRVPGQRFSVRARVPEGGLGWVELSASP